VAAAALTRLRWHFGHVLRSVGLPGYVATVVLLGCAIAWWGVAVRLQNDTRRLDAANAASERRIAASRLSPDQAPATPAEQMARFEKRFPAEKDMSSALASLIAVARKRGLLLEQAEFKFVNEASEPLQRYSILLPVKTDYRSLRHFLRDALREQPGMAMEDLNLRRSDPKSPLLEAQMRFVLFVRKPA